MSGETTIPSLTSPRTRMTPVEGSRLTRRWGRVAVWLDALNDNPPISSDILPDLLSVR